MGCAWWVDAGAAAPDLVDGVGFATSGVGGCCTVSLAARAARMRCPCAVVCLALRGLVHRCVDDRCPFPSLCTPGQIRSCRPLRPRGRALRRATGGNPWLAAEATTLATPL